MSSPIEEFFGGVKAFAVLCVLFVPFGIWKVVELIKLWLYEL